MGKMSDHELLSPDNSRSGWDNVLLDQKINEQGVVAFTFLGKIGPFLATFHSTIKISEIDFLVKIRQNTKPIALLFGAKIGPF